jgi:hypothetical protein
MPPTSVSIAPQDQFPVGAMLLARKSFTDAQALQWNKLVVEIDSDGTFQKIARKFMKAADAKALRYSGPRTPD